MRRRNKKKVRHDASMAPMKIIGIIVVIATSFLGYVWLNCRCQALGQELKVLENKQELLVRNHREEQFKWTRMKAPQNLEGALARNGLDMVWPSNRQVVRIRSSRSAYASTGALPLEKQYARLSGTARHD